MKRLLKNKKSFKTARKKLGMAIYILPNLFTTANVFWGFFAIVRSFEGRYLQAAFAIITASIFDLLDGRIARLTKTTSEFGIQYDSMADIISFALAPAMLMFTMSLKQYGRLGWTLCFLFFICGALRLARFNVQTKKLKDNNFVGLPSPTAALVIATFIVFITELKEIRLVGSLPFLNDVMDVFISDRFNTVFMLLAAPILGLLMVSPIKYSSFKDLKLKNVRPFYILVWLVVALIILVLKYEIIGFLAFIVYTVSGPILYVFSAKYREPSIIVGEEEHDFSLKDDYESDHEYHHEHHHEHHDNDELIEELSSESQGIGDIASEIQEDNEKK